MTNVTTPTSPVDVAAMGPGRAAGTTEPVLTICIPTYNRARALDTLLYSIWCQFADGNPGVEVVVSDNASTDQTEAIGRRWAARCPAIRYYRNPENIGGVRNFWKVTEYVRTPYFWFMGDDAALLPYSLDHVVDILRGHPATQILLLSGSNNARDQRPAIQALVESQGEVIRATNRSEFICSFSLQTLGYLGFLALRTDAWRRTDYANQPPYFIYPQIRSVLEMAAEGGDLLFSNRIVALGYRADGNAMGWFRDKAPVSITMEFPWLSRFAREKGFDTFVRGGLHDLSTKWKLNQWIKMCLCHPFYRSVYGEIIAIEPKLRIRILMRMLKWVLVPFRVPIRRRAERRGARFPSPEQRLMVHA